MILDKYLEQVDITTNFIEDTVRQIRLNIYISDDEPSREILHIEKKMSESLFECYMSYKEISIINKKLKQLVSYLEDCDEITDTIREFIIEKYFSPDENYPISVPVSNYLLIIEESFDFQRLSATAFFQMFSDKTPDMVEAETERDLKKQEIINDYESYLKYMDNVLGMIHRKQEPIDILIYLKQNVL